jgi:hypothetical protein
VDPHVDAIGDGAGDLSSVFLDCLRHAGALAGAVLAAGAGIQRRDEHEIGGEGRGAARARDGDLRVFKRFAQGIHHISMKFREFI